MISGSSVKPSSLSLTKALAFPASAHLFLCGCCCVPEASRNRVGETDHVEDQFDDERSDVCDLIEGQRNIYRSLVDMALDLG